jgi:hypothetical protein
VVASWQAADNAALMAALKLDPLFDYSPFRREIHWDGVDENDPPPQPWNRKAFQRALTWQKKLLAIAGWPDCRAIYEKELVEAIKWKNYCADLIKHPEYGRRGTGADPVSRQHALDEAHERVLYRRRLLLELEN